MYSRLIRLLPCVARRFHVRRAGFDSERSEAALSAYFEAYVACGRPGLLYALRHPGRSLAALIAVYRLPHLTAHLTDTVEGSLIRRGLSRTSRVARTAKFGAIAVLILPRVAADYALGSSKQTLRRKARAAQNLGVRWAEVNDVKERQRLLELANEQERNHPQHEYRDASPANDDLLEYRLWLAAYSPDGKPLLLSVTPFDGDWAFLRYFRTLGVGPDFTNSRYFMTQILVERLVKSGVRYLTDSRSPASLPNGLRHYQRMLGFRNVLVRVAPCRARPSAAKPVGVHRFGLTGVFRDESSSQRGIGASTPTIRIVKKNLFDGPAGVGDGQDGSEPIPRARSENPSPVSKAADRSP